jgi:hypothetical protein
VEQEAFHALFVPLSLVHGADKKQTDEMVKVTLAALRLPACLPGIKVSAFASLARTNFHNTFYIFSCSCCSHAGGIPFSRQQNKTKTFSPRQRFFCPLLCGAAGGNNLPRHISLCASERYSSVWVFKKELKSSPSSFLSVHSSAGQCVANALNADQP